AYAFCIWSSRAPITRRSRGSSATSSATTVTTSRYTTSTCSRWRTRSRGRERRRRGLRRSAHARGDPARLLAEPARRGVRRGGARVGAGHGERGFEACAAAAARRRVRRGGADALGGTGRGAAVAARGTVSRRRAAVADRLVFPRRLQDHGLPVAAGVAGARR